MSVTKDMLASIHCLLLTHSVDAPAYVRGLTAAAEMLKKQVDKGALASYIHTTIGNVHAAAWERDICTVMYDDCCGIGNAEDHRPLGT
jgi:hypothetical protein